MSLFGSLYTGTSGIMAQSNATAQISENIANLNTTGYKKSDTGFFSLVASHPTTPGTSFSGYDPGIVTTTEIARIDQQGGLQQTGSRLDAGITGNGFFAVHNSLDSSNDPFLYTRNGMFEVVPTGNGAETYLQNTAGFFLYGWELDANGNVANAGDLSSLVPLQISPVNDQVIVPTTAAELGVNLDADQSVNTDPLPLDPQLVDADFARSITVFDQASAGHPLNFEFRKVDGTAIVPAAIGATYPGQANFPALANVATASPEHWWEMTVTIPDPADPNNPALPPVTLTQGLLNFNPDGTLNTNDATLDLTGTVFDNAVPTATADITVDMNRFSQFAGGYNVLLADQNGAPLGERTGVEIQNDGTVIANYSNGQVIDLYRIPVATFTNANGLNKLTGTVFAETQDSGTVSLSEAGMNGAGNINSSVIENSNVVLEDEFSKLIVSQRAFQANSRVINTVDEMTELLGRLKR